MRLHILIHLSIHPLLFLKSKEKLNLCETHSKLLYLFDDSFLINFFVSLRNHIIKKRRNFRFFINHKKLNTNSKRNSIRHLIVVSIREPVVSIETFHWWSQRSGLFRSVHMSNQSLIEYRIAVRWKRNWNHQWLENYQVI